MSFQTHSPDPNFAYNHKIICYAVNNILHQLLICDKEYVQAYCLETNRRLREFYYPEKFLLMFEEKCKIKAAEACLLQNLWLTLINKKSFVFFNENLSYSRIFKAEHNNVISMSVISRFDDILLLRNDRKALKVWKYEILENNLNFNPKQSSALSSNKLKDEAKLKLIKPKRQVQLDRYQKLHEKAMRHTQMEDLQNAMVYYYAIEVNLWTKRLIQPPSNKTIMQYAVSEELQLVALSLDTLEVCVYGLITGDLIATIENFKIQVNSIDTQLFLGVANIYIDQELLYCCDDKKFVIFDLILNQEIVATPIPSIGRIINLACLRPTPQGGIFFFTTDEMLHCYSYSASNIISHGEALITWYIEKIVWSENVERTISFSELAHPSALIKKKASTLTLPSPDCKQLFVCLIKNTFFV